MIKQQKIQTLVGGPILFGVLVCIGLIGCGSKSDNIIRFGLANAPITLDPRFATDAVSTRINRLIYRQLIDFDLSSTPVPSLAVWRNISPSHYRFTLKPEFRQFHDGTSLTARDVQATFQFILDAANGSPHRATLKIIHHIDVVDEDTVDFLLNTPDPLFPGYLDVGILPDAKIQSGHPFNTHPVGSGPFRFLAWPDRSRLQLQRRKDQQTFEFLQIKDDNTRLLKLLRGEIDIVQNNLDAELIRYASRQPSVTVQRAKGSNFSYLGFNLEDDATGNHNVRLAIAHAINRDAIVKHLFNGGARLANTLLTPDHWATNTKLGHYDYSPSKARRLLAELGYNQENPLRLVYKTSNNPFRIRLATVIQSQLREVGIDADVKTYDWGTYYSDIKSGNFQMYSLAWVGINLPDIYRYVFHSDTVPPNGANRGRYSDHNVDALLGKVRTMQSVQSQAEAYHEIQQILLASLPYVPLWYEDHVFVMRHNLSGYRLSLDGNYDALIGVNRTIDVNRTIVR